MAVTLAVRPYRSQGRDWLGALCATYVGWQDSRRTGIWKAMKLRIDKPVTCYDLKGFSIATLDWHDRLPGLLALHNRAYVGAGDYRKASWIERWSLQSAKGFDPSLIWIAYEGDTPVGYCMARCLSGKGHITGLAVLPDYRRRNIGTHLMRTALYELTLRGAKEVVLEVPRTDGFSQDLYRKLGFE